MLLFVSFYSNRFKEWAKAHMPSVAKMFKGISKSKWIKNDYFKKHKESSCFDIEFFGVGTWYRIIFVLCSIISIGTYGYFYCLCLPYVFLNIDVMQDIVKALTRRGERGRKECYYASILLPCFYFMLLFMSPSIAKQLFLMACFIFSLLLIYAVLSFAIMSSFFKADDDNHFCTTLFQCLVTVTREGLLDGFGVSYNYAVKDLVFSLVHFLFIYVSSI